MRRHLLLFARRNTLAAIALTAGLALGVLAVGPGEPASAAARAHPVSPTYYVSLGDSYAVGYQPGKGATPGYARYVATRTGLTLANFGCGGATTTSLLTSIGCHVDLPDTAGGRAYPTTTQMAAAAAFIAAHKGHIGLITVTIGGNDVVPCAANANPIACVATAVATIKTNVTSIAAQLRSAAGPHVPIIGSTYPDVVLGAYVYPAHPASPAAISLAKVSVLAFKALINPTLSRAYATSLGAFVDVTRASGAYTSLKRTVHTAAYGTIPVPVASVCALAWYCASGDIHPKNAGYTLTGKLIVAKYDTTTRR